MATARKTVIPVQTQLEQLAAEFAPGEHKSRTQGGQKLTYISIDATINRLNQVLGSDWGTSAKTSLTPLEGSRPGYLAQCELHLTATVDGVTTTRYGVGAMVNGDPDMAAKTALAEAIKKAGHAFGVGLYLWDADARAAVEKKQKLAGASAATLKQEVFRIAKERTGKDKPSATEIAKLFDVQPGDLADDEKLREILAGEGLL